MALIRERRHRCRGRLGTPWDCPACDAEQEYAEWLEDHPDEAETYEQGANDI